MRLVLGTRVKQANFRTEERPRNYGIRSQSSYSKPPPLTKSRQLVHSLKLPNGGGFQQLVTDGMHVSSERLTKVHAQRVQGPRGNALTLVPRQIVSHC